MAEPTPAKRMEDVIAFISRPATMQTQKPLPLASVLRRSIIFPRQYRNGQEPLSRTTLRSESASTESVTR